MRIIGQFSFNDTANNECMPAFVCFPQVDGQEAALVVSAQEIRVVSELLQISPESLQKAVTYKMTVSTQSTSPSSSVYVPKQLLLY